MLNPCCRMETPADDEAQILDLVRQREEARRGKDWKRSDALRDALKNMGISIKDTPEGTVWKRSGPDDGSRERRSGALPAGLLTRGPGPPEGPPVQKNNTTAFFSLILGIELC